MPQEYHFGQGLHKHAPLLMVALRSTLGNVKEQQISYFS